MKILLLLGAALSLQAQNPLINFTAHETIDRSVNGQHQDYVDMDVSFLGKEEEYSDIYVNDRARTIQDVQATGWLTYGDYARILDWTRGRADGLHHYTKAQRVFFVKMRNGKLAYPAMDVVIEKGSVRIITKDWVEGNKLILTYVSGLVTVAGQEYMLPKKSELSVITQDGGLIRNIATFDGYKRFGATSGLVAEK